MDLEVVRTKAVKCSSKVFIPPQPNKNEHFDTKGKDTWLSKNNGDYPINEPVEFDMCNGLSSFACGENNQTSDFMMDFNEGELCFTDLLSSYFPDSCVYECSNDYDNGLLPTTENSLIFSSDMLCDWTLSNSTQCGSNCPFFGFLSWFWRRMAWRIIDSCHYDNETFTDITS